MHLQPVSPVHYHGQSSAGTNDSFGDFVDSSRLDERDLPNEKIEPQIDLDEDWQDADLVEGFSPVTTDFAQDTPAISIPSSSRVPPIRSGGQSHDLDAQDWAAWETPRGPSPQPLARQVGQASTSKIDDAFFAAFEQASVSQPPNKPSPPIIDLRNMERILEERKRGRQAAASTETNFFDAFDKTPGEMISSSRERSDRNVSLKGSQLENMKEAQASPLDIFNSKENRPNTDYFGGNQDFLADSPVESRHSGPSWLPSPGRADSWTETAGNWAGTFKKTLGTLRGQAAEFAQHLPSSKDFIVPEDYLDDDDEEEAKDNDVKTSKNHNESNGKSSAAEKSTSPTRRIARAADHSQSTPFGMMGPSSPTLHTFGRGRLHSAQQLHGSIKGAPGFDPSPVHNWNTGSWSLSSTEESSRKKKPIPVQLIGRREETQEVMKEELASVLTPRLPKRMQLGKSWKLLYSSDQHGISLGTLYHKMHSGLDLGRGSRTNSGLGAATEAEGWLRGASETAQEAVTGIRRVGGGLDLAEAGLILAVKDSEDQIFGAYVNERLRAQTHYYGNGEW